MTRSAVAVALAALAILVGACGGGSSLSGTYSCPENTTLELKDDGTYVGTDGEDVYRGTYEVQGDTISFSAEGLPTVDGSIQDDGSILFSAEEDPCVKR